jgi:hypothetical protein
VRTRSSIELGRATSAWPAAATATPVLGFEQAALDEWIEVEGGKLSADPNHRDRSSRPTGSRLAAASSWSRWRFGSSSNAMAPIGWSIGVLFVTR